MTDKILTTHSLTKSYKGVNALQDVSITLEAGKIYGLIGQNGAGKTTLMRVLAGLSYPTTGSISLFGRTEEKDLQTQRKRLGCLIEHPSFNGNMTAAENMRLHRIMRGIPNEEIESELLELMGISNTGKKKVNHFSMGMKQRLGVAVSLISRPEFLILDEPINGLDPVGVIEIREIIKKLCTERGITILISSHNLPELYQVATDYLIIHQGQIKEALSLSELEEHSKHHILIGCNEPEKLTTVLEAKLGTRNYKVMPNQTVKLYEYLDRAEEVSRIIQENGIIITNLSIQSDSLESYYMNVIGGGEHV